MAHSSTTSNSRPPSRCRLALLTCKLIHSYTQDEQLLIDELSRDAQIELVSWDDPAEWTRFDAVIIRTTWDYAQRSQEFLTVLQTIQKQTKLFNSFSVVNWNIHKFYLKELEERGISIPPTVFFHSSQELKIPDSWSEEKFVIKPAVSASAYKTMIVGRREIEEGHYLQSLHEGEWLLQPFMDIISKGEYSLVYFNKKFSHALLKTPKAGEFRVQTEYGGRMDPHSPSAQLREFGDKVIREVDLPLLYARVDLVPWKDSFALMELELIEPALYFSTHNEAAKNFKEALREYL